MFVVKPKGNVREVVKKKDIINLLANYKDGDEVYFVCNENGKEERFALSFTVFNTHKLYLKKIEESEWNTPCAE